MRSKQLLLVASSVALVSMTGCAARVYDNGYAYNNQPGYDDRYAYNDQYSDQAGYNDGYAYDTSPDLVVLPGTDIYAVPSVSTELYFVDGWWWRPMNGRWYRSHYYDRDWGLVSSAPYFYRSIPHGWRDDYYQGRWRGRSYDYYHVSRNDVSHNWDKWKREGYWRDNRWESSRDQYRRERVSSDGRRYEDRQATDGRYERRGVSTQDRDRNDRYTQDRERSDRYTQDRDRTDRSGVEYRREASSPGYRYENRTHTERTVTPASRETRERREVRPTTTRTRTETRTVPAARSTRTSPTSVRRTEQPTHRTTTIKSKTQTQQRSSTSGRSRPEDRRNENEER